ncbi:MAG: response regulator transcription factor [Candidatus Saccharimonadales bacterium]
MSKSILVIEDETDLREVYKIVLSAQGYEVYTAKNGVEGIKQLTAHRPALLLLDLFMPIMDGKEFLRNIDVNDYSETTFVVFTNLSNKETEAEMLELGAHKVMLKASMTPQQLAQFANETTGV